MRGRVRAQRHRQPMSPRRSSGGYAPKPGQKQRAGRFSDSQWTVDIEPPTFSSGTSAREEVIKNIAPFRPAPLECSHAGIYASGGTWTPRPRPAPAPARPSLVIHSDLMTCSRHDHMMIYGAPQLTTASWRRLRSTNCAGALARERTIPNYQDINVDTAIGSIFKLVGRCRQNNRSGPVQRRQRGAA
jgi:hypothetical protein